MTPFFTGILQEDISIRGFAAKSPLFYPRLSFMAAVFPANLAAIRARLPDDRYHPVRIAPGRGLAAIHCLQYEESDIGPYNELSVSVPVQYGRKTLPGPVSLLRSLLSGNYHAHVLDLPVTTEVALHGGVDFFGFPKYLADLTFRETATHRICTLRDEESLDLIAEFECRKFKTTRGSKSLTLTTYPQKDGRTLRARVRMNLTDYAISFGRGFASVTTGRHPRAAAVDDLALGRPLMVFYVPRAEGILFMPEDAG